LPDQSVDLALFIGVLPYLQDAGPVLSDLHRVLKPGSILGLGIFLSPVDFLLLVDMVASALQQLNTLPFDKRNVPKVFRESSPLLRQPLPWSRYT